MEEAVQKELYNYIRECLYDPVYGLKIQYNHDVYGRDEAMNKNIEVLHFMTSSLENEKKVIDEIINKGIAEVKSSQYTINGENVKKFLNLSTIIPLARAAYERALMAKENDEQFVR